MKSEEEELWTAAMANTIENAVCTPLSEIIPLPEDGPYMVVATNKEQKKGAAAIYATSKIREYFPDEEKVIVLPSSIHEVLIMPLPDGMPEEEIENLSGMITQVNEECVMPTEVLGEHPILLKLV